SFFILIPLPPRSTLFPYTTLFRSNIRQNLFFAFIYNSIGVPIAAGILYPFFGLLLSPILAAAAMSLSSVSVIGNSLRLRKIRLRSEEHTSELQSQSNLVCRLLLEK